MKDTAFYIGIVAGILTSVAALPQLFKILKDKQADDISLTMFVVLLVGLAVWTWYGFLQEDLPLIITNILSFAINGAVFIFSIRYKKRS